MYDKFRIRGEMYNRMQAVESIPSIEDQGTVEDKAEGGLACWTVEGEELHLEVRDPLSGEVRVYQAKVESSFTFSK